MMILFWVLVLVFGFTIPLYHRASLKVYSIATAVLLVVFSILAPGYAVAKIVLWAIWLIYSLMNIRPLRFNVFSKRGLKFYRKIMPTMSDTEREALEAGTVGWDAELFAGRPDWHKFLKGDKATISIEEQAFIDGPVEALCRMIDDWDITHKRADLSPEVWEHMKKHGFFGMIIPKEYGGKAFSSAAIARILVKLFAQSITVATTVAVPNSLGPGELLHHYGTQAQKDHYLPRLADGREIPCFALTSPDAGSDAGAMPDYGVICKGKFDGKDILGIKLNFNKRYITLAPVATVVGLAFKLFDPDKLVGEKEDIGITCALIPRDTKNLEIGRRHFPLNAVFQNGPLRGKDVFIPIDWVIGGEKMLGQGWRMLMECLAAGRAISLPSSGVAAGELMCAAGGAYARIRRQFNVPIGKFEGIEECLGRCGGYTYQMQAMTRMTQASIDQGQKPPVISAILKYHCTELGRKVSNDSMDIHGGKGICLGPNNYLGRGHQGSPIAITVEGANILTRSLIIFGQGAVRCHPFVLKEMQSVQEEGKKALKLFDKAMFGHIGFMMSNMVRSLFLAVTGSRIVAAPKGPCRRYMQHLTRFSSAFGLLTDVLMIVLGGELKRKERKSARLGDILSYLYIASSVIKKYNEDGCHKEDLPVVHWACQDALFHIQTAFKEILDNMRFRWLAKIISVLIFPLGARFKKPADYLDHKVSGLLINPTETRARLTNDVTGSGATILNQLEVALHAVIEIEAIEKTVKSAAKKNKLKGYHLREWMDDAVATGLIAHDEYKVWLKADKLRADIINVDDFSSEDLAHLVGALQKPGKVAEKA